MHDCSSRYTSDQLSPGAQCFVHTHCHQSTPTTPVHLQPQNLYPELGVELKERAYGGDCRLYIAGKGINWDTLSATLLDEFVIAHTLGWWGKALIMRNYPMLWTLSIGFELMELTFQHMLPNFNECWWDRYTLWGVHLGVALCVCV